MPKVAVVVTAHNYGRFLRKCLNSVLSQTFKDYEIIAVDDASTDETPQIIEEFKEKFGDRFKTTWTNGIGLAAASNAGIELSDSDYIVRLDADDWFDENFLLIESHYLDTHPETDMVYSDYYTTDANGNIVEHFRYMRANDELKLLDRSPLASGAMYKKACWAELSGYNSELRHQEDFDYWIRFVNRFNVACVNLPLYYYRRHGTTMSSNTKAKLAARRKVKADFVEYKLKNILTNKKIVAIIPARGADNLALKQLNGRPVIAHTIEAAKNSGVFEKVIVSTDSKDIAEVAKQLGAEVPFIRPETLASRVAIEKVLSHALDYLERVESYEPDIVALLHITAPFKTAEHIREAVHTLLIFDTDTVISVAENNKFLWKPDEFGLTPLFEKRLLRHERESLYVENGAIYVFKKPVLDFGSVIGKTVGNILMTEEESIRVDNEFGFWLAEQMLKTGKFTP